MNDLLLLFYNFFVGSISSVIQIISLCVYIFLIRRFKISGQQTAQFGFLFFIFTAIFVMLGLDEIAGIVAQYMFLLFCVSFIQEFVHFLRYENGK